MTFERYMGEDENAFITRVCDAKDSIGTWEDVADILNDALGYDYSSSKYRKSYQYFNTMLAANQDKYVDYQSQVEEIERLKDELYKERCKLQDANREKRGVLREEARFENLVEVLKDTILNTTSGNIKEYNFSKKSCDKKYAVLCLSDWHCGALVDNQFNFYNVETMIDRAYAIRDKAIKNCQLHNVTDLIVEINGDMLDGLIHVSSRVAQEEDVLEQLAIVTDLLAKMIGSMKPYFNSIKIVTTLGNHGRLTSSKNDCSTKENFEMLIPKWLRDKEILKGVTIIDSKGVGFVGYEVDGKFICVSHGNNDKLSTVISDYCKLYKRVPDEIHLGHFHGCQDINDCDVIVNVNGSLIGSDDYALSIRKVTAPSQNLIIYDEDRWLCPLTVE